MKAFVKFACCGFAALVAAQAQADIFMTAWPGADGAINISGVGSGVITADAVPNSFLSFRGYTHRGFDAPFLNDTGTIVSSGFISSQAAGANLTGSLTNLTTGVGDTLRDVGINWASMPSDQEITFRNRFSAGETELAFSAGDEFSLSFSGVISRTGIGFNFINFSDLIPGVYTTTRDAASGLQSEIGQEVFGTFTLTIVPEPTTAMLAACGSLALLGAGSRRRNR